MHSIDFLGLQFDQADRDEWISVFMRGGSNIFGYVVTPNVDHVISIHADRDLYEIYRESAYRICDSKIISRLGVLSGLNIRAMPGADLVSHFLGSTIAREADIAVLGPSSEDFLRLQSLYPDMSLKLIESPANVVVGAADWNSLIDRVMYTEFDVLICCLGHPKQELLCRDLARAGQERGLVICAGASIDFLTGRQRRAPFLLRRLGLEWFFRLMTNPRRLWRRYVVRGPHILWIYLKWIGGNLPHS